MSSHVYLQVSLIGERFLAYLADMRTFPCMGTLVDFKAGDLGKLSSTHGTRVWFVSSMNPHVDFQGGVRGKRLLTYVTGERFFACVTSFMNSQIASTGEVLMADAASVWLQPLVYDEDMPS